MKINRISVFEIVTPYPQGYGLSRGRIWTSFESTIVKIETDAGIVGWGELQTLGGNYLPAFARGAKAAIEELAPHLIGENPLQLDRINYLMDHVLYGHPYAKSPIDMACWDILGKATEMPLCDLLGGRFEGGLDLMCAPTVGSIEEMLAMTAGFRENGFKRMSLKLGGDVAEDVSRIRAILEHAQPGEEYYADCNRGWTRDQALRVMRQIRDLDIYIEQPCASYEDCLAVRRRTDHPMILDEIVDSPEMVMRIIADGAADLVNIKISRVGGLTKARRARDMCVTAGLPMTIQDVGGSGIVQAAIYHLAQSTPKEFRHSVYDPLTVVSDALTDAPIYAQGGGALVEASDRPGLGQEPLPGSSLGDPIAVYGGRG
ncbi:mandelate racemase/muconate lactonizing enzyme family protein [Mesorhizobium opportunistum]|uniref:mandelate racemase/muconate lactonizing enzyme family protein n=1 Tax=Mesorhizobium opportunistum TaxID=593909 RepID=UPI00333620A8